MSSHNAARLVVAPVVLLLLFGGFAAIEGLRLPADFGNHDFHLARAFLHGSASFLEEPGTWGDTSPFEGHDYWPLGPFPAVVLMPFALVSQAMGVQIDHRLLSPVLVALVLWLAARIARQQEFTPKDALYLAFAYGFASAFIGVAAVPVSWFFAHTVATVLLLAALAEHFGRDRPWLVGLAVGLATATRVTAGIGIVFFVVRALAGESAERSGRMRDDSWVSSHRSSQPWLSSPPTTWSASAILSSRGTATSGSTRLWPRRGRRG